MNRHLSSQRHQSEYPGPLCAAACGALVGAGFTYLFDPSSGGRRRSLLRGRMTRMMNQACVGLLKTAEYAGGQIWGLFAETRRKFRGEEVPDETLRARVRSTLGRVVSHPKAVLVDACDGNVLLCGAVLADEVDGLLKAVKSVPGVKQVDNLLDVRDRTEEIPELQGGAARTGPRYGFMQDNWSPSTRAMACLLGATVGGYGAARRDPLGIPLALLGAALFIRGASNQPARRLTGIGAGRRAVDVQKTININLPPDIVFSFFADYQNFPYFMSNVVEVSNFGDGRSRWTVKGPAGISTSWDAEVTQFIPNQVLAWRSIEGSTVANAGVIRFTPNEDGGTRVDIKLSYNPPGGALGHLLAKVFGADPKSEMDQDLLRAKTLLETGQVAHDAAKT